MVKFFQKLIANKEKNFSFSGGIYPPEMKIQSNQVPLITLPLPNKLIIPIQQHIGAAGDLIVKTGDYVLKGQALTRGYHYKTPIHASTSGTITAIEPHITAHPSGLKVICIQLQPDNKDKWGKRKSLPNYLKYSAKILLLRIEQAGIVGLGGEGFPTAIKLKNNYKLISTLIINAAECEPHITADDCLIQEHANEIIEGILILIHILKPKEVLIGIEDNKPAAIMAFKKALLYKQSLIKLKVIPTRYPSGEEKQLIKILTGQKIPSGVHSSFIGILVQNVGTVFAIKRAIIDGKPLIERVVTLTGSAIQNPGNYWVRLGVPVNFLLQHVGIAPKLEKIVIMGGPFMGFILPDLSVPIIKVSNCIFVPALAEINKPSIKRACIRCGFCVQVCPVNLLPQQLYWFSQWKKHEEAKKYNLSDCIECGACAYVCPSNIPLVQYYQQEKAELKAIVKEKKRASDAKKRFEAKKNRLKLEKTLYQQQRQQSTIKLEAINKVEINVEEIENQVVTKTSQTEKIQQPISSINPAVIKIRENQSTTIIKTTIEQHKTTEHRKMLVAAAIARVKAKRSINRKIF